MRAGLNRCKSSFIVYPRPVKLLGYRQCMNSFTLPCTTHQNPPQAHDTSHVDLAGAQNDDMLQRHVVLWTIRRQFNTEA